MNLSEEIKQFYDNSTGLWEEIWGEHLHHGYYGPNGDQKKERRQAQIDLIEEILKWAPIQNPKNIIDIGCGIGGSTLYLAEKYNANATGITLSPVQANRATERAKNAGLDHKTQFHVIDALQMPFPDNSFDLIWSLESGEHIPNKQKFLQECYRILQPGGTFIFVTWCHRNLDKNSGGQLTDDERKHLAEIYRVYCLPYVISLAEYEQIATEAGFKNIQTADWSKAVAPFWDTVIDSALNLESILGLINAGWTTIQAALSLPLMSNGYKRGLIKFGLLTGTK